MEEITIGDAVEVLFILRQPPDFVLGTDHPVKLGPPPALDTLTTIEERWVPATVCHVTPSSYGVAFSDGERMAIQRNSGGPKKIRRARPV